MVMLSSRGVSETRDVSDADLKPFDLPGDELLPDEPFRPIASIGMVAESAWPPMSLLAALRQWAEMQRQSYEILERAFANAPPGISISTSVLPVPPKFPDDLLRKPMENILITDERLGLPPGCLTVLGQAGIVSLAVLVERMNSGELTKIPRVGKAKAAVIGETLRAFLAAVKAREQEDDSNEP